MQSPAVGPNTWRGFHRIDQTQVGAKEGFQEFFLTEKERLLSELRGVCTQWELDDFEERACADIRSRLTNTKPEQLRSYNKMRKPVDLYVMNLVTMARELDPCRGWLVPCLHLPLDSWILRHPGLFADHELRLHGLSRNSGFGEVTTKRVYQALQTMLKEKARQISLRLGQDFQVIYFDLLWGDRHLNWGDNLFEANPH